ncbi:MAG TPA: YaeQ family protein [Polyangiaceae bacterium]|nr:YaeQ family protein [Polyangiaceae bacterium]
MAPNATLFHLQIELSDVDRQTYESLELRLARHPSESMRYLMTRTFAYCLSYEEGIAFSKGGLSSQDEPPVSVRDHLGVLRAWIDVGAPSTVRVHKASKASHHVAIYGASNLAELRSDAAAGQVHHASDIDVWTFDPDFLDALEPRIERSMSLTLVRTEGQLYVTTGGTTFEGALEHSKLLETA